MKLIGVDLYQHLLEGALLEARGDSADEWTPVINFEVGGRFDPQWIPEDDIRVSLYVRLARIAELRALDSFEEELVDRFGELPAEALQLIALTRARVLAREAAIEKIDAGPAAIAFTRRVSFSGDAAACGLEQSNGRLLLKEPIAEPLERLARAEAILAELAAGPGG